MSAAQFYMPFQAVLNTNSLPVAGGQLCFYYSGTLNAAPVYSSPAMSFALNNPVIANGAGRFVPIYMDSTITYRVIIRDAGGSILDDFNPFIPGAYYAPAGAPGGNVSSVGLFSALSGSAIPAGTSVVSTSGYNLGGRGVATYVVDAAVDSSFVAAHPTWSFISGDGRGWRLSTEQKVYIEMFGAVGDAHGATVGTDDYAAFTAALDFQNYFRQAPTDNTDYKPTIAVHLKNRGYRCSNTLIFDRTATRFIGTGYNFNGFGASCIFFDSGKAGIVVQCWNNTGIDLIETLTPHTFGTDPRGAQNTYISDISLFSRGGTVGATNQNGVLIHTACVFERVFSFDFGGNGFAIRADVASGTNANACQVLSCGAYRSGLNGYYDQGGDVNAGVVLNFQSFNNRQFGLYAGNFLGQFYLYFQCDGNGISSSGPNWATTGVSSYTNYSGHIWYVRPGQHAAASTTTPGTNSAVWIDQGAGATSLGGNWVNGQTFTSGGGFYAGGTGFAINNSPRNVFAGYCEGNQYPGWSDSSTSCSLPGFAQFQGGSGASIQVSNSAIVSPAIGYQGTAANGDTVTHLLTGRGGDGSMREWGRAGSTWREFLDASCNVSYSYNGAAGTSPINFLAGGNHPFTAQMSNGCYIGSGFVTSGSAAPTTGTWARGDRVNNDGSITALGTTDHWVCSVSGSPGTWIAKA